MLLTLHPALLKFAQAELRAQGLNETEAPDVVQDAYELWLRTTSAYLHETIRGLVRHLGREGRDAMTRRPLSLDQIEEE